MPWTERQQQMLRAMGLRVWSPASPVPAPVPALSLAPAPVHQPAPVAEPLPPAVALMPAPVMLTRAPDPPDERSLHIAALDWTGLREAVAACRACSLCETRRQTVFGVGHPEAHWLVVGEAPGEQEDRQGEPFVGPAGQLLDAMLRALRLTRAADGDLPPAQRVYIANTLKCRPPGNRNPTPGEMQRCEPFLLRQIALLKPKIVLAMGRFAVQSLLNSGEPIGKLRGRVHRWQGLPLVVTYHPAYLLRSLPDKARAWEDLCLAARVADEACAA